MSPARARKSAHVALVRPDRNPLEPVLVGSISENAPDTASQPLRPVRPVRVDPRHLDTHGFDDPCNYLG